MTLITYLTRVHFADGVLEEALRSELEMRGRRRPLIVAADDSLDDAIAERLFASLPMRVSAEIYDDVPPVPSESTALRVARQYRESDRDCLIACGTAASINLAKAAGIAIGHDRPVGQAVLANRLKVRFAVNKIFSDKGPGIGLAPVGHSAALHHEKKR